MSAATPMGSPAPLTNSTSINLQNLQIWWLDWMTQSPTPFGEKMTLFLHGHFTSDYRKVGTNSPAMYWQNLTWRRMAMGDLKSMLLKVTPDLAMLRYLDLAVSTGKAPNENYARELMELFTLGVGNYTEDDVKAAAKALAGWRLPTRAESTATFGLFDTRRAFTGPVTFLGKTATFDTATVIDQILAQDAAATFVTRELARFFVSPGASDAYVNRLADGFRRSKYNVKTLMRDVFMSPEFLQPTAYRSLVKSPTEVMLHLARALEQPTMSRAIAQSGSGMGQALYDPPEVGGWPSNASWVSSNNVLTRVNFVVTTLGAMQKLPAFGSAHQVHLDGIVSPQTAQLLNSASDDQTRWLILLASPEFQLK